jgi:hypothetical protein
MTAPERRGPERPGPDYPPEWDLEPDDLEALADEHREASAAAAYEASGGQYGAPLEVRLPPGYSITLHPDDPGPTPPAAP